MAIQRANYLQCDGEDWRKARMRALVRDDFTCQHPDCEETRLDHLAVHHKKYRINGGTHDLDNLVTLCKAHHADMHPHLRIELDQETRAIGYWQDKEL